MAFLRPAWIRDGVAIGLRPEVIGRAEKPGVHYIAVGIEPRGHNDSQVGVAGKVHRKPGRLAKVGRLRWSTNKVDRPFGTAHLPTIKTLTPSSTEP
jgi:hypothetical protein